MSEDLLNLMQKTRVRKYHKSDPRKLLNGIVTEIKMKTHHYGFRCWEMMVEYLAKWLVLNKKTGLACTPPLQGFKGLDLKKDDVYNHIESLDLFRHYYVAAMAKPMDYIGDVYERDLELTQDGQNMTPESLVRMMIQMTYATSLKMNGPAMFYCYESYLSYLFWYGKTYHAPAAHLKPMDTPVKTQLDPCVGTGRFLFIASQMMPQAPLVLFGIEINVSLYRACLVNMAMFSKHPYSIVCADSLMLEKDKSGPFSKLWDLGNQWNPPNISAFYWKPPPIWHDRFSLKHFATEIPQDAKQ